MTLVYFGDRWDSPIFDTPDAEQVPTPIGTPCHICQDDIEDGDRGQLMGFATEHESRIVPAHIECLFLTTSGHMYGICGCHGYTLGKDARAALVVSLDAERATRGQGPWFEYERPRHLREVLD